MRESLQEIERVKGGQMHIERWGRAIERDKIKTDAEEVANQSEGELETRSQEIRTVKRETERKETEGGVERSADTGANMEVSPAARRSATHLI